MPPEATNNVIANNTVRVASDGRWALLVVNASTGNRVFNNILLNDGSYRGSMSVSAESVTGLVSDYNVVMDRFTLDDGGTRLTRAQWQAQTGQDAHSKVSSAAALFVGGTDYHLLASINGLKLTSAIRERSPSTRIALITAYATDDMHRAAAEAGADYYLPKPFLLQDLEPIVRAAVALDEG